MDLSVSVLDSSGKTLWMRDDTGGIANREYASDGTQEKIIDVLDKALEQARAELRLFPVSDRVLDIGRASAQV